MAIVIVRTLLVYLSLMFSMRILGKRQLGEMELSEFIVAALAADLAAIPLQDIGIPMINGLVSILVLFCCEIIVSGATMKSLRLRSLLFGRPSVIIDHGVLNQQELRRNRLTLDELQQELRLNGATDISRIEYAILETDGKLSILLYAAEQPVTAGQLGIAAADGGYVSLVINDGRVLDENLTRLGLDRRWLTQELKSRGVKEAKDVFMMTVTAAGQVYFCKKETDK